MAILDFKKKTLWKTPSSLTRYTQPPQPLQPASSDSFLARSWFLWPKAITNITGGFGWKNPTSKTKKKHNMFTSLLTPSKSTLFLFSIGTSPVACFYWESTHGKLVVWGPVLCNNHRPIPTCFKGLEGHSLGSVPTSHDGETVLSKARNSCKTCLKKKKMAWYNQNSGLKMKIFIKNLAGPKSSYIWLWWVFMNPHSLRVGPARNFGRHNFLGSCDPSVARLLTVNCSKKSCNTWDKRRIHFNSMCNSVLPTSASNYSISMND